MFETFYIVEVFVVNKELQESLLQRFGFGKNLTGILKLIFSSRIHIH